MAFPTTVPGSKLLIEIGDGATPTEVFDQPCALNSKGINFTAAANEQNVPDCDDPDAAMWIARTVTTLSAEVAGSGILALESYEIWREWFASALFRNAHVKVDVPAPDGGYYSGRFILSNFNTTGNQGELSQVEVTMQSDGPVLWVASP